MSKSCCFIIKEPWATRLYEEAAKEEVLSAFLYYLTFALDVKRYYFLYDEKAPFPANAILERIRLFDPSVERILLYPERGFANATFAYSCGNRFEKKQNLPDEMFSKEDALHRFLIEQCDFLIFSSDEKESFALAEARRQSKTAIDFTELRDLSSLFRSATNV